MNDILFSCLALSVVLLGIHAWFGLEIIRRGILFTDLAIGQMAAFGAAGALYLEWEAWAYPCSLGFALATGGLITWATRQRVPLEAFIGLVYALGISGVFLLLSGSPHGLETFQRLMAADILFIPWSETFKTALLYGVLGIGLWWAKPRLKGIWGEMLFFLAFAVTVTSSVKLAGVLVVFALLVAPALIALQCRIRHPMWGAWGAGVVINSLAIVASYRLDWPTGYTLVFFQALAALGVCVISSFYLSSKEP